jgi:hypothetical protein
MLAFDRECFADGLLTTANDAPQIFLAARQQRSAFVADLYGTINYGSYQLQATASDPLVALGTSSAPRCYCSPRPCRRFLDSSVAAAT